MGKSVLYIVGAVVVLGGGAFLFLKNKNRKDALLLAELNQKKAMELEKAKEVKAKEEVKPETLSANDLLTVAKLKDAIIAETKLRNSYKKDTSKANVQASIDEKIKALAGFGFALDMNNELIKIR